MKVRLTAAFIFVYFHYSFAQQQTNYWFFGVLAGLDFSSGSPTVLTNGMINTNEGTSAIADSAGNLLFYTDGIQVWNKNNVQMPNGFGLKGDVSTTQTLIVPNPGNPVLYYIFTLDDEGGPDGLNYSTVDMSLDSGRGDVSVKNSFLRASMSEKLAGVYHCNNHDIWVMTHERGTDAFLAYLVTDNGVSANPVISNTGLTHTDIHGQIKFSSDGARLACAVGYQDTVQIFDFDNKTGILSNPLSFPLGHHVYGLEFSPDNSKLYGTYYDVGGPSELYQLDLNAADIFASKVVLSTEFDPILYAVQLAPDNKIYVVQEITPFLSVINSPNLAGTACDYVDNAINLDPQGFGVMCMLGLPGFIQSYFNPGFAERCTSLSADFQSTDSVLCISDCISFLETSSCSTDTWQWTFAGAAPASSTVQNPQNICYAAAGDYTVELIASNGCITDTLAKIITVLPSPVVDAGTDVTIQQNESTTLNATGTVINYAWSPAAGLSAVNIPNPIAVPEATTTYYVLGTDENGCQATDSVTITVENPCGTVAVPDAFSPNNDGINDAARVLGGCIETMYFMIYNRWGEKVFETNDQQAGWDGTYKGEPMPISTFAYYFEGTLTGGEKVIKKGAISLVR